MNQSILNQASNGLYMVWHPRQVQPRIWTLAAATLLLGLAYAPNFRDLQSIWNADPNYSHGYLILPIALVILWRRLSDMTIEASPITVASPWWGWIVLCAVLGIRAIAYEKNHQWLETVTLLPVIACLVWTLGSWPLLRQVWPAILFLIFLLPLPAGINDLISLPLQRNAATGSCFLLQLSGLWAIQEGNVIQLTTPHGMIPLDVAVACNGLRMLMTMAATITATIILIPLPIWKRIVLLVSAIPIALVSNILRIVATGWCYYIVTGPKAKEWAHDVSGWMMMPLALTLVWLELQLFSWLSPELSADQEADRKLMIPLINIKSSAKHAKTNADLSELA